MVPLPGGFSFMLVVPPRKAKDWPERRGSGRIKNFGRTYCSMLPVCGGCPTRCRQEHSLVDIHRLFLFAALVSAAVALALNAYSVVSGKAWLFSVGLQ